MWREFQSCYVNQNSKFFWKNRWKTIDGNINNRTKEANKNLNTFSGERVWRETENDIYVPFIEAFNSFFINAHIFFKVLLATVKLMVSKFRENAFWSRSVGCEKTKDFNIRQRTSWHTVFSMITRLGNFFEQFVSLWNIFAANFVKA